jgi:hypothetical protein
MDDADTTYEKAFLLTYQSFTNPFTLLEKFIQRFEVPATIQADDAHKIRVRVVVILRKWIQEQVCHMLCYANLCTMDSFATSRNHALSLAPLCICIVQGL